jgi:micrococcal nuclease
MMMAARTLRNGAVLLMICVLWAVPLNAKDVLEGPVMAQVLRVIDGDTIEVAAHLWLG